jgi:hypothetical protein
MQEQIEKQQRSFNDKVSQTRRSKSREQEQKMRQQMERLKENLISSA